MNIPFKCNMQKGNEPFTIKTFFSAFLITSLLTQLSKSCQSFNLPLHITSYPIRIYSINIFWKLAFLSTCNNSLMWALIVSYPVNMSTSLKVFFILVPPP